VLLPHDGLDGGAGFEGDEADAAGLLGPEVQGNVAVHHRPELLEVPPEVVDGDLEGEAAHEEAGGAEPAAAERRRC